MDRGFLLGGAVGMAIAVALAYIFSWPSRRYLSDTESLSLDDLRQKYPEKYWAGRFYRTTIVICAIVGFLIYSLITVVFLLHSDAAPFIFPITFFPWMITDDAISSGVFEVVTKVSGTGRKIRWHYGNPNKQYGQPIQYFCGKEVRQAGKSRLLLGIIALFVNLAIIISVGNMNLWG